MGCGGSKTEAENQDDHEILPKKYQLSETSMEDFLSCEKDAKIYMDRHVIETYKVRCEQKQQLIESLKVMEKEEKKLKDELKRHKIHGHENGNGHHKGGNHSPGTHGDQKLVQNIVLGHEKYDEVAAYEKAEHLATLNRVEMLGKEIHGTRQHIVELTHECEMLHEDVQDLKEIIEMRNKILDTLFGGEYGSNKENQLEEELDYLHMKHQFYEEVNFKWRQAQVMVEYACKQIGTAGHKWKEIMKRPNGHTGSAEMEGKFNLAKETRNNLIAARQNLQGAHRYLPDILFPYCSLEEVEMLGKATTYVFTDMQQRARQAHALECYQAAQRRCGALLQWFNEVINTLIMSALIKVKDRVKIVGKDLRKERVHLIAKLIKEKFGKTVQMNPADLDLDSDNSGYELELLTEDDKHRKSSGQSRGSYTKLDYSSVSNAPSPLHHDELAPLPTNAQLFGALTRLKDNHMNHKNSKANHEKPGQRRNQTMPWVKDKHSGQHHENHGPHDNHGPHGQHEKNEHHNKYEHPDKHHDYHGGSEHHSSNGPNHKMANNHHTRHPNEVIEDLEEMDGAEIARKARKKIERY